MRKSRRAVGLLLLSSGGCSLGLRTPASNALRSVPSPPVACGLPTPQDSASCEGEPSRFGLVAGARLGRHNKNVNSVFERSLHNKPTVQKSS